MKFLINKKITSNIPSTKLFDLGVVEDINTLLNESIIYINQNTIPVLNINDSKYLINNFNPSNCLEDYEILLTESDLIMFESNSENVNAIPLTGTTVGNPVTGDIEFQSAISRKITSLTGGYIEFVDDGTMNINKDSGSNVNITGIDIAGFTNVDFGIRGFQDFTPNITDLDYTQKIYVDTYTQRTTATSGTVNIDSGRRDLVLIHEAGATTSLNLNLPTSPKNNQKVTIMSVGGIVGLTLVTAVGTIVGAVTTLAALGTTKLIWNSSQSKWYKIS